MAVSLFVPRRAANPVEEAESSEPEAERARGSGAVQAARKNAVKAEGAAPPTYAREAAAMVLLASALFATLSLASFEADPFRPEIGGADWVGPAGAELARALVVSVGFVAWLLPVELAVVASPLLAGKPSRIHLLRVSGDVVVAMVLAALLHVAFPESKAFGSMPIGGAIGELFGEILRLLFSTVGSYIIGLTIVSLILVGRASFSFIELVQRIELFLRSLSRRGTGGLKTVFKAWSKARELDRDAKQANQPLRSGDGSVDTTPTDPDALLAALSDSDFRDLKTPEPLPDGTAVVMSDRSLNLEIPAALWNDTTPVPAVVEEAVAAPVAAEEKPAAAKRSRRSKQERAQGSPEPGVEQVPAEQRLEAEGVSVQEAIRTVQEAPAPMGFTIVLPPEDEVEVRPANAVSSHLGGGEPEDEADDGAELSPSFLAQETPDFEAEDDMSSPMPGPAIALRSEVEALEAAPKKNIRPAVEKRAPSGTEGEREIVKVIPSASRGFVLPKPDLLEPPAGGRILIDEEKLKATAQLLEKTLADYGVSGKVEEIHPGPTVTTFEVSPAAGTKVSKVAGLVDDLALGLSRKVRIVAPIPGKNRIGFEIPNEHRMPVNLRELIDDRRFMEMNAPLPCVLGRDIIGTPYFADLSSMPHVIVAGATGAGKSVGLNVMLMSLLFRKTPDELRLLMVDPKVVELAPFDRIPHMLLPVVTDMKQASNALKWAVDEMERRYQLFANAGTRNITTYNAWAEKVKRGEAKPPKPPAQVNAVAADGTPVTVDAAKDGSDIAMPEKIPFILIVVDEFADLMMQQGKDVEASVARLAQKARAAGMHVILATQRPSVDVITGMIKANFPTRIAFRVAQKVDSRTILDEQGAEHLLGRGDMLVKMNGSNEMKRVQCPFCSEEDVQRVTDFLRAQGEPVYDEAILKPRDEDGEEKADTSEAEADPMYDAAVRIVADTRRCSTSWIQRKLGIGYNRAAKIVEAMEMHGLVGPANGAKDREVLISSL